jgi:hypothetical protein
LTALGILRSDPASPRFVTAHPDGNEIEDVLGLILLLAYYPPPATRRKKRAKRAAVPVLLQRKVAGRLVTYEFSVPRDKCIVLGPFEELPGVALPERDRSTPITLTYSHYSQFLTVAAVSQEDTLNDLRALRMPTRACCGTAVNAAHLPNCVTLR